VASVEFGNIFNQTATGLSTEARLLGRLGSKLLGFRGGNRKPVQS